MTDFRKCKYYDGGAYGPVGPGDCRHPAREGYRFSSTCGGGGRSCRSRCPMTCTEDARGFRDCLLWAPKGSNVLAVPEGGTP